jgi:uncharacterized protein (DUF488 family)
MPDRQIWTIGHSTHSIEAFVQLLARSELEAVADVRTVPRSRRHPQFSKDALAPTLEAHEFGYEHLARLGGWRTARRDSPNAAWQNASFRGYADYALTASFAEGLARLCELAQQRRTVVMCSEALWWRCHRRLIADRLLLAGWEVCHIAADGSASPHRLTDFAVPCADGTVLYPAAPDTTARRPHS